MQIQHGARTKGFYLTITLIAGVFCLPTTAFAVDVSQLLENIDTQLPYLFDLVSGFSYLAGVFFVIAGLHSLKEFGDSRAMSSNKLAMKEPLAYIIIGAMLIYLPSTKGVLLTSVYGTADISPYVGYGDATKSAFNQMGQTIVNIVQFVGFVAFVRGLFLMHKVGMGQAQQGAGFNKGLTHLIGGVIAMNIVGFSQIVGSTLGISTS